MLNALTIDVEDYYMVSAFADVVKFEDWHRYESRVEINTCKILDLFDEHNVKATFFVLGWIGEQFPQLVKDIHARGHEVASHGYNHRLVYDLSPDEFREDTQRAKGILENLTGEAVIGYRATSYSIVEKTQWALDILIDEGFLYDSSIFPIYHDRYGFPRAERFPHVIERFNGKIMEFPPSTYVIMGQKFPVAGGGYLRLYPMPLTRSAIRSINKRDHQPVILYIHPWEIDTDQPRLQGRLRSRMRHYVNLHTTMPKIRAFLGEFTFKPLAALFNDTLAVHQNILDKTPVSDHLNESQFSLSLEKSR